MASKKKSSKKKAEAYPVSVTPEDVAEQLSEGAETDPLSIGLAAIRVDPDLLRANIPQPEEIVLYHIGVLPSAPIDQVGVGCATFTKVSERPSIDPAGGTYRHRRCGKVEPLTKTQVELIKKHACIKMVRMRTQGRIDVVDSTSSYYRPHPDDLPVAYFIYARPIPEGANVDAMLGAPGPPMAEEVATAA